MLFQKPVIRLFLLFGRGLNAVLFILFGLAVMEYFTGLGRLLWSHWGFEPIVADAALR